MNDVCTVCPPNYVGLPAKVVQQTAFFSKKKVPHGVLFFCLGESLKFHFYGAWQVLLQLLSSLVYVWDYSGVWDIVLDLSLLV